MTEGEKEKEFREALQKRLGSAYGRWFANAGVCVDGNSAKVTISEKIDSIRLPKIPLDRGRSESS